VSCSILVHFRQLALLTVWETLSRSLIQRVHQRLLCERISKESMSRPSFSDSIRNTLQVLTGFALLGYREHRFSNGSSKMSSELVTRKFPRMQKME